MPSNGCGLSGGFTKLWKRLKGEEPPFEVCCDEHDLAYEQIETLEDKEWADRHLVRCMSAHGYPLLGAVFGAVVAVFGWLSEDTQKIWVGRIGKVLTWSEKILGTLRK